MYEVVCAASDMSTGQVRDPQVVSFLFDIRSKVGSGGLLDNDAVQQAYEAGCFCSSQLQLEGFLVFSGSAAPGQWHEETSHRCHG